MSNVRKKNFMIKLNTIRCWHIWKSSSTAILKRTIETSGLSRYKIDKKKSSKRGSMICLLLMVHQWHIITEMNKKHMNPRPALVMALHWKTIISKAQHRRPGVRLEVMRALVSQKHKNQQGLQSTKWSLIRSDHYTNLENIRHQDMLIQSKTATEPQVNLKEIIWIKNKPVKLC